MQSHPQPIRLCCGFEMRMNILQNTAGQLMVYFLKEKLNGREVSLDYKEAVKENTDLKGDDQIRAGLFLFPVESSE